MFALTFKRVGSAAAACLGGLMMAVTSSGEPNYNSPWDPAVPLPQFITHYFIEPAKLTAIAKFRSGRGHSFSDSYEPTDRSLKNYFDPRRSYLNTNDALPVFAPASGTLVTVTPEGHKLSSGESRGVQLSLVPDGYPGFEIRLFHVKLAPGLAAGSHVNGGDPLGHADLREAVNTDWAVGAAWAVAPLYGNPGVVLRPPGYRLLSPFDLMTDAAFSQLAVYGVTAREQLVVPLAYRNAHPGTFGGQSSGEFDPVDYVVLATAPNIITPPASQAVLQHETVELSVVAASSDTLTYRWWMNGALLYNGTARTLTLPFVQPVNAGLYIATVTGEVTAISDAAIIGVTTAEKVIGTAREVQRDIFVAANGNTFDQVLLEGVAATITADFTLRQITRASFVDLTNDIVQVEFSGPGTLSIVLEGYSGAALAVNYHQQVEYVKGHAGIVITGATEDTHVSVFSVGRRTAVNQNLFKDDVIYDGVADIAFIAISSSDGKFGSVRTANASYSATRGMTGVYAPGVQFTGPVFIGEISAANTATPILVTGSTADARITGGDLQQANGQSLKVKGLTQLAFTAGTDSHGNALAAKANRATLLQDGVDVTAQVVVNPAP